MRLPPYAAETFFTPAMNGSLSECVTTPAIDPSDACTCAQHHRTEPPILIGFGRRPRCTYIIHRRFADIEFGRQAGLGEYEGGRSPEIRTNRHHSPVLDDQPLAGRDPDAPRTSGKVSNVSRPARDGCATSPALNTIFSAMCSGILALAHTAFRFLTGSGQDSDT